MPNRSSQQAHPVGLSRIGQRRQVVIPKVILDALHLREGDFVEVTAQDGSVSLKPKKSTDSDDTLTAAEARKVRRGLKQLKAGKTVPWSQVKSEMGL
jgi:AbrB family looped-hinge helix DNA binding protein